MKWVDEDLQGPEKEHFAGAFQWIIRIFFEQLLCKTNPGQLLRMFVKFCGIFTF